MSDENGSAWRRLAAMVRRLRAPEPVDPSTGARLRRPSVRRYRGYAALQFVRGQTQSRMRSDDPDHLLIDYTRTMLGALLLQPRPRRIGIVGLGGGSQAKFCHRHLPHARIEAVENNAGVIALRREFRIPDDDERLQVVHDDGARFLRERRGRYDLLLVDGYDETGIPEALASQQFYDDCRAALAPGGVMSGNLYCADRDRHVERLRRSFDDAHVLMLEEEKMSNRVVFAWTGDPLRDGAAAIARNARLLPDGVREELADVLARVGRAMEWHGKRIAAEAAMARPAGAHPGAT
jgi:spermidine synthase